MEWRHLWEPRSPMVAYRLALIVVAALLAWSAASVALLASDAFCTDCSENDMLHVDSAAAARGYTI